MSGSRFIGFPWRILVIYFITGNGGFFLGLFVIEACNFEYDLPQIFVPGRNKIQIGFGTGQNLKGFPRFKTNWPKNRKFYF
jgi:hypothetical protein